MKTLNRGSKGQHLHDSRKLGGEDQPFLQRKRSFGSVHSDQRTVAYVSVPIETSSALAGELGSLFGAADGVGVTAVPPSETRVLFWLPSFSKGAFSETNVR